MAATLSDAVLDGALNVIKTNGDLLHICSSAPADYAGIAAVALGSKATPSYTGPANNTSGRKITIAAITDGTVSATGTASHVAISNGSDTLYAVQALNATQGVTSGNTFTLTEFTISIPDPTA